MGSKSSSAKPSSLNTASPNTPKSSVSSSSPFVSVSVSARVVGPKPPKTKQQQPPENPRLDQYLECQDCKVETPLLTGGPFQQLSTRCQCGSENFVVLVSRHGAFQTHISYLSSPNLVTNGEKYGPLMAGPLHLAPTGRSSNPEGKGGESGKEEDHNKSLVEDAIAGIYRKSVAKTFRGTSYEQVTPKPGTVAILVRHQSGETKDNLGGFWTLDHERLLLLSQEDGQSRTHSLRHDFSIFRHWNSLQSSQLLVVPPGIWMWKGMAENVASTNKTQSYQGGGTQIYIDLETVHLLWTATQNWRQKAEGRGEIKLDPSLVSAAKEAQKRFLQALEPKLKLVRGEKAKELEEQKKFLRLQEKFSRATRDYADRSRQASQETLEEICQELKKFRKQLLLETYLRHSVLIWQIRDLLKQVQVKLRWNKELILQDASDPQLAKLQGAAETKSLLLKGNKFQYLSATVKALLNNQRLEMKTEIPSGWITVHKVAVNGVNRSLKVRFEFSHTEKVSKKLTIYWYKMFHTWS